MRLTLGIDGGGTSTRCVVLNEQQEILGQGRSGPSNYQDVGAPEAGANLRRAIAEACAPVGGPAAIDAAFFGLAGIVAEADRAVVRSLVADVGFRPDMPLGVEHDCRVALAGGTGGAPGIVLIVGTGCSCYGRTAEGREWRSGGWGYLLDDVGSAFYLGAEALKAITRAYDGRAAATALAEPVLAAMGLTDVNAVMNRIYHPRLDRTGIAALAPIVCGVAEHDPAARQILQTGASALAETVAAVARQLRFAAPTPVVPVGGLVSASALYRALVSTAIETAVPQARVQRPLLEPAMGAALLARALR